MQPSGCQGLAASGCAHARRRVIVTAQPPLANPSAASNPFVTCINYLGQVIIGDHPLRDILPPAGDSGVAFAHYRDTPEDTTEWAIKVGPAIRRRASTGAKAPSALLQTATRSTPRPP